MEQARASQIPDESVAVLPFVNMSGDPENEYFSDGLTETLLHMLANLQDLQVSARTSSFAFKGQNKDIREIAEQLGVAHILEGSVQKAGNMVRVTAQLIRAEDGFHVWSQNFDRDLDNIFAIQDEIATEVASALGSTLLVTGISTENLSAYDLYLQGLEQHALKHDESLNAADALFRQALEVDLEFHDARLALAKNNEWRERKNMVSPLSTIRESHQLLNDAVAGRPDDLATRTLLLYMENQIAALDSQSDPDATFKPQFREEAEARWEELVSLFSQGFGDPYVRRMTANWLRNFDEREEEEYKLIRDGLVYDPLNFDLIYALALSYMWDDRLEDSYQTLLIALGLEPDNPLTLRQLSNVEWDRGNFPEMLDWLRKGIEADPSGSRLVLNMSARLGIVGMYEESKYWADRVREMEPDKVEYHESLDFAEASAQGDNERIATVNRAALIRKFSNDIIDGVGATAREYIRAMHRLGRSQEAADFLESLVPNVFDTTFLPANWEQGELKFASFALLQDLVSREEFIERLKSYIATLDAAGIPWRDDKILLMNVEFNHGNFEAAKALFIEIAGESKTTETWWTAFIENPWRTELHNDPEIAAILANRERELAALREELKTMFQRPEWQY
jgi:TolB-like protein